MSGGSHHLSASAFSAFCPLSMGLTTACGEAGWGRLATLHKVTWPLRGEARPAPGESLGSLLLNCPFLGS